jgi:hypothetical protein
VIDGNADRQESSPAVSCGQTRRIDKVLGTILMGPGEVLVLVIITGVIVVIAMCRARMKK